MINWFGLPATLMDSPDYRDLTPTEKLYLLTVVSEWSLRGPFYKADVEFAAFLGCSEVKVRQARRRATTHCLVDVVPGNWARNRRLATRYIDVPCATASEGVFFAQIHRYAFESLMALVRRKNLQHVDVVVYITLAYFAWKFRGARDDGRFFLPKCELRECAGAAGVVESVQRLYGAFVFTGGGHLFEFDDGYHKLVIKKWAGLMDPSENENNRGLCEQYRADVKKKADAIRTGKAKPKKPTRRAVRR